MKNVLLSFYFLIIAMAINAQNNSTQDKSSDNANAAIITFDNIVHDYGAIVKGSNGNCTFTFKNTGNEPLVLTNVTTSCGCTIAAWTKEPILPGKTGEIKVNYTKTNIVGTISKQITVISNASNGTIVLSIKGSVVEDTSSGVVPEKQPNELVTPKK
ncbi:MAG TPA: DUF1573 domain-containing protein [Bacteroidales bacterium]|nr:DUF1573 domain-containing protein [Bacteroidales bacterium]HPS15804.1 DUF1573 domain-containing protein [Bacteroidales bacterium]